MIHPGSGKNECIVDSDTAVIRYTQLTFMNREKGGEFKLEPGP